MSADSAVPEVLIIDDEVQIQRLLTLTLETAGYRVRQADSGQSGIGEVIYRQPDAIILDLGLPDLSGMEVLKRLREWTRIPVLVLSVKGEDETKIAALDAGADDYLTKPFSGGELLARIRVMLRRQRASDPPKAVRFGDVEFDLSRRLVTRGGEEVHLTAREQGLLRILAVNAGRVVTHGQILRELWGPGAEEQTQYLRVYMARLRQKLEESPNEPRFLKTESGVGYRLMAE